MSGERGIGRTFLGVALDDETRHALAAGLDPHLGDGRCPGRPVPVESWHLTVRFLGVTGDLQRDLVLGRLAGAPLPAPFRVRFGGLGAFPRPGKATVLWLGVEGGDEDLVDLAVVGEEAARGAGFDPEERPFHPHLTLARIRPPVDVAGLVDAVPAAGVSMRVGALTLFRSVLGGGRPARYEVVDEIPLG